MARKAAEPTKTFGLGHGEWSARAFECCFGEGRLTRLPLRQPAEWDCELIETLSRRDEQPGITTFLDAVDDPDELASW
ncbi:MAG: hypothetical protein ABIW50_04490 [Candidatus Limnocylindria bacterium]